MGALQHDGLFVCARAVRVENVQIWGGEDSGMNSSMPQMARWTSVRATMKTLRGLDFVFGVFSNLWHVGATEANLWEVAVYLARGRHAVPPSDGWKYLVAPIVRVGV